MKFLIVVLACSICLELASADESRRSAQKSTEEDDDDDVSDKDSEESEDVDPASVEQAAKHRVTPTTYEEAQKRYDEAQKERQRMLDKRREKTKGGSHSEKKREKPSKVDESEESEESDEADGKPDHAAPGARAYAGDDGKDQGELALESSDSHPIVPYNEDKKGRSKSSPEDCRKRQQLLFALSYVKSLVNDPELDKKLHASTKQRFTKEMRRLEAELKSIAVDESPVHHKKRHHQ